MDISLLADSYLPTSDHVIRVAVAVVLGGLIGLEREVRDKPAGFRTIVLLCVGACLFTIVSELAGGRDGESTRIAAQIVSGIGFLGAGAILRDRASVIGLTTAATIWAVAAVGMAAGYGFLGFATVGTVIILIALVVFDAVENWIGDLRDVQEYRIVTENSEDTPDRLYEMISSTGLSIRKRTCFEEGSAVVFYIVAMGSKSNHDRLRRALLRSDEYSLREARQS